MESAGPIVLGPRLENSLEPRAWRTITYGKGIVDHPHAAPADGRRALLRAAGERCSKRYDHKRSAPTNFRALRRAIPAAEIGRPQAGGFLRAVGVRTGIPTLKLNYSVKGKARPCGWWER